MLNSGQNCIHLEQTRAVIVDSSVSQVFTKTESEHCQPVELSIAMTVKNALQSGQKMIKSVHADNLTYGNNVIQRCESAVRKKHYCCCGCGIASERERGFR